MSWELLPTNYTDAVWSGLKRYNQIDNQDGTVSFQDVTLYSNRENSFFGALQANRMNDAINTIMSMVENGTNLYEAFQNYFDSQKVMFEDEMGIKQEELNELFAEFAANYQSDINQFEANQEQIFNIWFDFIKGQLGTDVAGNLQNQINELANAELPKATQNSLGGIIVGQNLSVDTNGVLSAVIPTDLGLSIEVNVHAPSGTTVTCTDGATTLTGESVNDLVHFVLSNYGTWTISGSKTNDTTNTVTLHADTCRVYDVTLTYFKANVRVNVESGASVTISSDTWTQTATSSSGHADFVVKEATTYSVVATYQGVNTQTKTVTASTDGATYNVALAFITLTVSIKTNSSVTVSKDSFTYTKVATNNQAKFYLAETGTWNITCSLSGQVATGTIECDSYQGYTKSMAYAKVYGIRIDTTNSNPSTCMTRTDDAVGFTATASVGSTAGSSSFDNCYPWSGIVRENIGNDVMVKIPKFYYRRYREGNIEYIKIADKQIEDFELHPAFSHNNAEQDYIYLGAYKTSSNNQSKSGASPTVNQTRATFRNNAKNKGTGWGIIDFTTNSALQLLYLVEFANYDSQTAVGRGYCDSNSSALSSGSTNNVPNLTGIPSGTNGKIDVVYRGIEGIWGNIWEFVDGLNNNGGEYWYCNDQTKYADDTSTNYTKLSYQGASSGSGYINSLGLDTSKAFAMLPTAVSGSETTYMCDYGYFNSDWRVFFRSGYWYFGSYCGVFCSRLSSASSSSDANFGSRLLYIPS